MKWTVKWIKSGFIQEYKLLSYEEENSIKANYKAYQELLTSNERELFKKNHRITHKQGEIYHNSPLHTAFTEAINGFGVLKLPETQGGEHQLEVLKCES